MTTNGAKPLTRGSVNAFSTASTSAPISYCYFDTQTGVITHYYNQWPEQ